MSPSSSRHRRLAVALACSFIGLSSTVAFALPRTWIGGNADWLDGGSNLNWNPNDEPDADDEAIFNTANGVNLGSNNAVNGLTMSGGIDLNLNSFDLVVDGLTQLTGASTNLFIDTNAILDTDNLTINSGGIVDVRGGVLTLNEEVGTSLLDINVGGTLIGSGVVNFADTPGVATTGLINDGTLTARSLGVTIFSPPPTGSLSIGGGGFVRVDLDGAGEAGVVNINRNQELSLSLLMTDAFNGTMNLAHNAQFSSVNGWSLGAGGSIVVNNGFVAGGLGFPDTAADVAYINNGPLTQTGGTLNVADADGTLQLNSNFTMSGGTFTNFGTVIFNGVTNITTAAGYDPSDLNSQTIVNANVTINDAAGNFNWDGNGAADTTINGTAALSLTVNQIDTGDNVFGGTINLNDDGDLFVNNVANTWTMGGTINKNNAGTSSVTGDALNIAGAINVSDGTLTLPTTTLASTANVTVAGTLSLGGASVLAGPNNLSGAGTLRLLGTSTTAANTTINTTGFDFDGTGTGTTHTINDGVVLTINSTVWDADDTGDVDDPITIGGNGGTLAVNNVPSWTMARTLTTNSSVVGITSLNGNSRMILAGASAIWNANGQTSVNAVVTFGASSVSNIAAAGFIRLNGGDAVSVFNRIEGGTVNGPGQLVAINNRELRGFGTIAAPITFQNTSSLRADDGTLTVSGTINQVSTIGTADNDGVLNVVNAWNSNVASNVVLNGGTLQGGAITVGNANGISGRGLVTARIINNARLNGNVAAQTLVFQTAANDNDWDGGANTGLLVAGGGGTLEIRDVGAAFGFGGSVVATGGSRVFSSGFALDFNPGSSLSLTSSTYESSNSTDIGGTVTVGAGAPSTIRVTNNFFLTFQSGSAATLNGNLQLQNNNIIIQAGATFSGGGSLVVPSGSHMVANNLANVGVLLQMDGSFRPGNSEGIGRVDLFDFQQSGSSQLFVEFTGTALNSFDRLVASGDAVVDGYLHLDIDGVFVPSLGNTFNIVTANTVTGAFDTVDMSGMPAGLTFAVTYLGNAVQLVVVNKPLYAADFDDDGDVDLTDLSIWTAAFNLNQLGDANGDNITDGSDWTIWRDTFGSTPLISMSITNGNYDIPINVPEPASLALLGGGAGLMLHRRRRARQRVRAIAGAAALAAGATAATTPSTAVAAPTLSVVANGSNALNNRLFTVRIAPDPALFVGGDGSLATELGLNITTGNLVSATINGVDWPYALPGKNPFVGGSVTTGLQVNTTSDTVFASFGSNEFASGAPVAILTLETQGIVPTTITWGGHNLGSYTGSRISQNGINFNSVQGNLSFNALPGDANLDKSVNFDDLLILAANYNGTMKTWALADFTFDGTTNFDDLLLLAANYNQSLPGEDGWALAAVAVPEPGLFGIGACVAAPLLRRRRR